MSERIDNAAGNQKGKLTGTTRVPDHVPIEPSAASSRLRALADEFDANAVTYGEELALDVLLSDLQQAEADFAARSQELLRG